MYDLRAFLTCAGLTEYSSVVEEPAVRALPTQRLASLLAIGASTPHCGVRRLVDVSHVAWTSRRATYAQRLCVATWVTIFGLFAAHFTRVESTQAEWSASNGSWMTHREFGWPLSAITLHDYFQVNRTLDRVPVATGASIHWLGVLGNAIFGLCVIAVGTKVATRRTLAKESRAANSRWQFGLRQLAIGILVIAACFGKWVNNVRQEQAAIEMVVARGGSVVLDYELTPLGSLYADRDVRRPSGPYWLVELLGDEYFSHVRLVNLAHSSVTSEDLGMLQACPSLGRISLEATSVDDECVATLIAMKQLRDIDITNTRISSVGWSRLLQAKGLHSNEIRYP